MCIHRALQYLQNVLTEFSYLLWLFSKTSAIVFVGVTSLATDRDTEFGTTIPALSDLKKTPEDSNV